LRPVEENVEKSIFSKEYALFLQQLRSVRTKAGMTQAQLAAKLGRTQSFVSKCERGERRLDIVELRAFCRALGISLTEFTISFETAVFKQRI